MKTVALLLLGIGLLQVCLGLVPRNCTGVDPLSCQKLDEECACGKYTGQCDCEYCFLCPNSRCGPNAGRCAQNHSCIYPAGVIPRDNGQFLGTCLPQGSPQPTPPRPRPQVQPTGPPPPDRPQVQPTQPPPPDRPQVQPTKPPPPERPNEQPTAEQPTAEQPIAEQPIAEQPIA